LLSSHQKKKSEEVNGDRLSKSITEVAATAAESTTLKLSIG